MGSSPARGASRVLPGFSMSEVEVSLIGETRFLISILTLRVRRTFWYHRHACFAIGYDSRLLVHYQVKPGATHIVVLVLHWSHTTPYLEFLREVGGEFGRTVWNTWQANLSAGQGRPFVISTDSERAITLQKLMLPPIGRQLSDKAFARLCLPC